jgi:hypothetical protein
VLVVACAVNDPKVIDEIEKTRTRLRKREIEFEPLFSGELTEKLRTQATIIDRSLRPGLGGENLRTRRRCLVTDRASRVGDSEKLSRIIF